MTDLATNVLYYGDNLDILRRDLDNRKAGRAARPSREQPVSQTPFVPASRHS